MQRKLIAAIALALILSLCAMSGFPGSASADPAATVLIQGSAFVPDTIRIKAGQEVVWKNMDQAAHTVTADDGSFDSGAMDYGAEYRRVFAKPGAYSISCGNHAWMAGRVIVE